MNRNSITRKYLSLIFCLIVVLSSMSISAFASTSNNYLDLEIESNDTKETATLIRRNSTTAVDWVNGKSFYHTFGEVSNLTDEDWFEVWLPSGTSTLNFANYTRNLHLVVEVEDIYGNIVFAPTIINVNDREAHNIDIPTSGNYYIRISTNEVSFDTPISYRIVIGEPFYTTSSYTYNFNNTFTISSSSPTATSTFSTKNITSIPDKAIIYRVAIGGTQTNKASKQVRSIRVGGTSYWIDCPEYMFTNDNLVHLGIKAKNNWDFKLTASTFSSSSYSLKPNISISYVYPES